VLTLPLSLLNAAAGLEPPLWRRMFDLAERPLAAGSEHWMQTDAFMDAMVGTVKLQQRLNSEVERGMQAWLGAWGMPTRADVAALSNQVASLERTVRELQGDLQGRS
jgi:polyhydroxyalkanoate synthesis regulator phasin